MHTLFLRLCYGSFAQPGPWCWSLEFTVQRGGPSETLETWLALAGSAKPEATGAPLSDLLFYPAWEASSDGKLPHADVISDRLQTLVALSEWTAGAKATAPLVVTSVAALMQEETFAPGGLQARARHLARGDGISRWI